MGNVHILLQGHWFTQEYFIPADDVTIGSKVIGKKKYILLFDSIFILRFKVKCFKWLRYMNIDMTRVKIFCNFDVIF